MTSQVADDLPRYPFVNPSAIEPPVEWAAMRGRCPVARVRVPDGGVGRVLTRYQDIRRAMVDRRLIRSMEIVDESESVKLTNIGNAGADGAPTITREEHLRWRNRVAYSFKPRRIAELRPLVAAKAEALIGDMIAAGSSVDLLTAFASPLPVWVICELLGVPLADREKFSAWSDTLLAVTGSAGQDKDHAGKEFFSYTLGLVSAKRADPGDDLVSDLVRAVDAGEEDYSDGDVATMCATLLMAGYETVAQTMLNGVAILLGEPDRWAELVADPALIPSAVEEILRLGLVVAFGIPRYLTEDFAVGDTVLAAGTSVLLNPALANRDGSVFADPDRYDSRRSPNPHLAFGAGRYACFGQELARAELQIALTALTRRLPALRLAKPVDELHRRAGQMINGFEEFPVRW